MKRIIAVAMLALMFSSVQAAVVSNVITQTAATPSETTGTGSTEIVVLPASGGGGGGGSRPADVACNRQIYPYSGFLCGTNEECVEGIAYTPLRDASGFCCNIKCTPIPETTEAPETQPNPLPVEAAREYHPECNDMNPCTVDVVDVWGVCHNTKVLNETLEAPEGSSCFYMGKESECEPSHKIACVLNGERGFCVDGACMVPFCVGDKCEVPERIRQESPTSLVGLTDTGTIIIVIGLLIFLVGVGIFVMGKEKRRT